MNILVDIDNTLWDFSSVLFQELSLKYNIPDPEHWVCWDFWKEHITKKIFYDTANKIHQEQEKYIQYPEAKPFLRNLKEKGHIIIIASHRAQKALEPTITWLRKNDLPFDKVHLSYDKTVLFDCVDYVIDDSPSIINKACLEGIPTAALRKPWNAMLNIPLYKNLLEIKLNGNNLRHPSKQRL